MLAFVDLEERVPQDHPIRTIKIIADDALERLSPEFDRMYSKVGRASVPPERLLKASLLIGLYSVRSERAFCEELEYNLLFRWFLDMNLMERSFDPTVFTKNRRRLLEHRIGQSLFDQVVVEERDAVPVMLDDARQRGFRPRTLAGDKGYDTRQCVKDMRDRGVTPHVAQRVHSAIDERTTRHSGYGVSQKIRKQIEEIFGWMKTVGGFRRTRYRGVERTGLAGYFVATAYNLVRMANLLSSQRTRDVQVV